MNKVIVLQSRLAVAELPFGPQEEVELGGELVGVVKPCGEAIVGTSDSFTLEGLMLRDGKMGTQTDAYVWDEEGAIEMQG